MNGGGVPQDAQAGLKLIREASVVGSLDAQSTLGQFASTGQFGPKNLEHARRYYRLCAAGGLPTCQEEVGKLLLAHSLREGQAGGERCGQVEVRTGETPVTRLLTYA